MIHVFETTVQVEIVDVYFFRCTVSFLLSSIWQFNGSAAKPKDQGVQTERAREGADNTGLAASLLASQPDTITCNFFLALGFVIQSNVAFWYQQFQHLVSIIFYL